jgi:hypothetical protein
MLLLEFGRLRHSSALEVRFLLGLSICLRLFGTLHLLLGCKARSALVGCVLLDPSRGFRYLRLCSYQLS